VGPGFIRSGWAKPAPGTCQQLRAEALQVIRNGVAWHAVTRTAAAKAITSALRLQLQVTCSSGLLRITWRRDRERTLEATAALPVQRQPCVPRCGTSSSVSVNPDLLASWTAGVIAWSILSACRRSFAPGWRCALRHAMVREAGPEGARTALGSDGYAVVGRARVWRRFPVCTACVVVAGGSCPSLQ
jgi:hypothetical protein